MTTVVSYGVEVRLQPQYLRPTIQKYRTAISFLVDVYQKEWEILSQVLKPKERFNLAEHMVHSTKDNRAIYSEFDVLFAKMPSYLRRAAIQKALGITFSYQSNLQRWRDGGEQGKPPKLQLNHNVMPVFYHGGSYRQSGDITTAEIKLFWNNDWVWIKVPLVATDARYLQKHWTDVKASAPTLEKRYKKYFLRFSFNASSELSKTPVKDQTICSVDLGINTDAVCSIMRSDGTILTRKFIDFPSDKDHLSHVLNRIKKQQRDNGSFSTKNFWEYATRLNREHAAKVAGAITTFAAKNLADVIVFEHLSMQGRKHGSKKQRLSLWRKNDIQTIVTEKAHRAGIRVRHICAWGTSKLAFDGSGIVQRNPRNHSLCLFPNGKQYNCDLSASYNIGARYFIRELLKPFSEMERSRLLAKVPEAGRRTSCTLSTLIDLQSALGA